MEIVKISSFEDKTAGITQCLTYTVGGPHMGRANLTNSNVWNDFPDLVLDITPTTRSHMQIHYNIAMPGSGTHLCTKLMIDSKEVLRDIKGDTAYWGASGYWCQDIDPGLHRIKVQYRTPGGGESHPAATDWQTRQMQVTLMR